MIPKFLQSVAGMAILIWAIFVTVTAMLTVLNWIGGSILIAAGAGAVLWLARRLAPTR